MRLKARGQLIAASALVLLAGASFADDVYPYESIRCIPEIGFFEYGRFLIYNVPSDRVLDAYPEAGIRPANTFSTTCKLNDRVSVLVDRDRIQVREGNRNVFAGPKALDIIRVNGEGTIELCLLPNELDDWQAEPRGKCLWRGFEALKEDGPRSPGEAIQLIRGNDSGKRARESAITRQRSHFR